MTLYAIVESPLDPLLKKYLQMIPFFLRCSYSKVQARYAFATYLIRVQQRLVAETTSEENEDVDIANEQMVRALH